MKARLPRQGDRFPDIELLDHEGRPRSISSFFAPPTFDRYLGFDQGYPLIVTFIRGPFCPRDQAQMRQLVQHQDEFGLSGCSIVTVSVQHHEVLAAFRFGLGASWAFLSDPDRQLVGALDLIDATEGEEARVSRPMTFVLDERRAVHSVYDGWWSIGRPTIEEVRHDVREIMTATKRAPYAAWSTPRVTAVRVPQQRWLEPHEGEPGRSGRVSWFDRDRGIGMIVPDPTQGGDGGGRTRRRGASAPDDEVFFHFTAIPGSGYRTVAPGRRVRFDVSDNPVGPVASRVVPEVTDPSATSASAESGR
jgi:peroxiredoxin/cold shock CspA family protein